MADSAKPDDGPRPGEDAVSYEIRKRNEARLSAKQDANQQLASNLPVADVARSAVSGVGQGVRGLATPVGDAINLADTAWQEGIGKLLEWTGAMTPEQVQGAKQPIPGLEDRNIRGGIFPTSELATKASEAVIGPDYEPTTPGGRVTQTVASFGPGAVTPGAVITRAGTTGQRLARLSADAVKQMAIPGLAVGLTEEQIRDSDALTPQQKQLALTALGVTTGAATHKLLGEPNLTRPSGELTDQPGAAQRVGRDIRRSGGAEAVTDEMLRLGDEGMLVDAADPLRNRGEALAARSYVDLVGKLRERGKAAGNYVAGALDSAFGSMPGENWVERTQKLQEARRQTAKDLYGQWRSQVDGVRISTDGILDAVNENLSPAVKQPGSNTKPNEIDAAMIDLNDTFRGRNDGASLHGAKLDLDRKMQVEQRNNGETPLYRAYAQVKAAVIDALDNSAKTPTGESLYKNARRTFAGDSAILEARERGERLFSGDKKYTADHLELDLRDMSPAEKTALLEGARANLHNIMGDATNPDGGANKALTTLRSGDNQRKLQRLQADPDGMTPGAHEQLNRGLEGWARMQGTGQSVVQNSATARRQAILKDTPDPNASSEASLPREMTLFGTTMRMAERAYNALRSTSASKRADQLNLETEKLLGMRTGDFSPEELRRRVRLLDEAYGRPPGGLPAAVPAGLAGLQGFRQEENR
jgi:hypothetical protein